MEHTKPPGEPMALFRRRVLAWNNGEPVKPTPIENPLNKHVFYIGFWPFKKEMNYCQKNGCYAQVDMPIKPQCPFSVLDSARYQW